jgi:transcriptional regulator with XRE-family HTH domain
VAVSSSSSALRAKQELAERLREIRLDAGLTGRVLSAAAGWHESKASRIESAKQAPGDADIRTWCQVCDAEDQVADLIAASRAADSMYVEWRRLHLLDGRSWILPDPGVCWCAAVVDRSFPEHAR